MGVNSLIKSGRLRLLLGALIISSWAAARPAGAMPHHPRVAAELARRGELAALGREQAALARQGLDRPAREVLAATARAAHAAKRAATPRNMHIAVLLVDFSDNDWRIYPSYVPDHYTDLLFTAGTHPTGSLRDYYLENSRGDFDLTGQVSGWHRMPQTYRYYVAGRRGTGGPYPQNGQKLVEDAVRLADAADPALDFSRFDNDGPDGVPSSGDDDGTVDGLIVVHAGPGFEETSNPNDIHSHYWNVVDEELVVDGVRIFNYMLDPQDGRAGVFAHEFGHNIGLVDLYETDGGGTSVVGVWSVMSLGAWLSASGGAFGPGSGSRPSHLDAWSKVATGFATPVDLTDNVPGRMLEPVVPGGEILRLWTNGRVGSEYFLVENRAPVGFDRSLPFTSTTVGGLLIWHVDEETATNDDAGHPRVALEQADGRRDIEAGRNYGDESDPYSLGRAFTPTSQPASLSYSGADTQVRVENFDLVTGATYAADFTVETAPALAKVRLTIDDATGGNGDGGLDATERGAVAVEIENAGLDARQVLVDLECLDPLVTIAGGPLAAGDLAAGGTTAVPGAFTFLVADLPADPYALTWRLRYTAVGYEETEDVVLAAGDVVGFAANFEDDAEGFTHSVGRAGYRDDWFVAEDAGRGGGSAFRCAMADSNRYGNLTDARLDTPVFALDGTCRLFFWHTIDAEVDAGTRAWDGGLVELSLDGGPFAPIAPVGGYPYRIIRNGQSAIADREAFSGKITAFERVEFDLTGMTGAGRLRFRFGSDGSVTAGGWVVDDVTVVSPAEPYAVTFLTPGTDAEGRVVVAFEVEEFFAGRPYDGRGFNVYRRAESASFPLRGVAAGVPAGYTLLTGVPLPPDSSYTDAGCSPAELFAYLLEDLRKEGQEPRLYGPRQVYVPGGPADPHIVRAVPSVFQPAVDPATLIQFVVPPAGGAVAPVDVELRVYDLAGRLVAELVDGPRPPGKNVASWNGYGVRGVPVPSGVYFLRLDAEGGTSGLRVVVLR